MVLLKIYLIFIQLSLLSFGGGYVLIPIMLESLEENNLATASEVTDLVALAGMSPGPVAVNSALAIGYKIKGVPGAAAAFLGILTPCIILVLLASMFFFNFYKHHLVQKAMYGLRPVVTGIILFAAFNMAVRNGIIGKSIPALETEIARGIYIGFPGLASFELKSILIAVTTFLLLVFTKVHPIFIIIGSGIAGILFF